MSILSAVTGIGHHAEPENAQILERSFKLAHEFSRLMIVMALIGCAGLFVLWLLFGGRYPHLLALAGVIGLVAVGGGTYIAVPGMKGSAAGVGLMLAIMLVAMFVIPMVAPPLISGATAGMILLSLVGQLFLGTRQGSLLALIAFLALLLDHVIAPSLSSPLFSAALTQELEQYRVVLLGNMAVILGCILAGRHVLLDYAGQVREERTMLRMLIDNLPDNVFIKDKNSRIIINNVAHARILGNSRPDQVVGKSDFDFFPRELAQKYYDDEQQIIRSGESKINLEEPVVDPEGRPRWYLTTKMLLRDSGEVIGIVGVNRDITELRKAELERDRLLQVEHEHRSGLEKVVGQLRDTAGHLSDAANQILAAATQQASSAAEQEAAITQTMTTVEEIRVTVRQTAERAQKVADSSKQSVNVAREGQQAVNETVEGMRVIRQRVDSIAQTILMLSQRMQQIGEIIAAVNDIANQSKLLALNASIEAARAGEEGRGFGVVAMEVRQLAEQSREATARVRTILNEIQQATNAAVMVTEEGSKGTEHGMALVERAGQSIQELASTIEGAAQAAIQIAASTHQQTSGMEQLSGAMGQIHEAAFQTAASVRQMEHSVQDLTAMAQQLEGTAEQYSS